MSYAEARAPGEKVDIREESLYDYIQSNDMGSRSDRREQTSTAHISSGGRLTGALANNQNARFAHDALVADCARFLGSDIINDTVTQFAENILTIIESPTELDSTEVKRRIEQILPTSHEYKVHRGMALSDKDCTRLCSLADRVINNAPYTNLNIVDENNPQDDDDGEREFTDRLRRASHGSVGDVQYIRHTNTAQPLDLPKQLPSFVEPNEDVDTKQEYDVDITPFDSEEDDD
ncbi:uncharacterized protein EV154DRAFT_504511 [Mucor mucedo]|uniref:uncharacterized protein n=1 Tax=Mucor mucedo TaxID=29922 RepID=UPI002220385F|nr:uncharacterized protein EV154DRAFT_504511 [Mucor mucedo]KAI7892456.1 hypothetical protein EV154DRAFT_504511 [Mucor mucedo]